MTLRKILLTTCLATLPMLAQADQPNILLIIADDMGLDASACYAVGNQQAKMPNIQAMCDGGLVFDNAYSAPVCTPTRATIMTGQYSFRTGTGGAIPSDGNNGLSPDVTSLFDVLKGTEYSANLIGKWHLAGADAGMNHPAELGVSDYWGLYKGGANPSYWEWRGVDNGTPIDVTEYATTAFTDRAIDWIGAQDADRPWFLWLAYNAPHTPFHLPPAHLHSAGDLPTDEDSIKADQLTYYNAMLEALDSEIGRLFSTLDDDTIVMFIGDNGSPNQVTRGFYGDHGAKGSIYEGGTHVPFVVTGPGIDAGRTDAFVQTTDLFTTIAGITGADALATHGVDFAPVLAGGTTQRDHIYVEHFSEYEPKTSDVFGWALRMGDHKLVAVEGAEPVLYDLAADPMEAVDLLADGITDDEAAIRDSLQSRADAIRAN
ncbi:sulfatase-like hydrolase/transferase [uncultured Pelagimonas sp.]|uniref:sulfatase-like hydrolase/transferase n=1 Tax=uncultured Pelagimonas sp. TaxID=1618102 RepID=UPI00262126B4|nr:sulfatase-like hydrolase/transferase [uncultured Pelagimonas sp.]